MPKDLDEFEKQFILSQEKLGDEFSKIYFDNLWNLYA